MKMRVTNHTVVTFSDEGEPKDGGGGKK